MRVSWSVRGVAWVMGRVSRAGQGMRRWLLGSGPAARQEAPSRD